MIFSILSLAAAPMMVQAQTQTPTTTQAQPQAQATPAPAATPAPNPKVGGVDMLDTKTIVDNASAAPNLTTLVTAVKAAGLGETLSGPGPFTVFAPTNDAFSRLAPGTVDTLLKPENKATLTKILTYHVVPGAISGMQLLDMIKAGGGKATLTTVAGAPLTAELEGSAVKLTDANGNPAYVSVADVRQSNGVVHVINGVLLPKLN